MSVLRRNILTTAIIIITTKDILSSSAQSLQATSGLYNDNFACPGQNVTYRCETRGSSAIAWSSDEYVGEGGAQIQFTQYRHHVGAIQYGNGDAVATLTANRMENGILVLVSTLCITASSMYTNPSVTCIHVDDERYNTTGFRMIAEPNAPQDVVALQIEPTMDICVVTALWHDQDNTLLRHYIATLHVYTISSNLLNHTVPASSILSSTWFSTVFSVPACGPHLISVQPVDVCGREGPFVSVALNIQDCFISQDSVCLAPPTLPTSVFTTSTVPSTTDSSGSATNKPLQGFSSVLNVVVIVAAVLVCC